jgi:hypothetical protein
MNQFPFFFEQLYCYIFQFPDHLKFLLASQSLLSFFESCIIHYLLMKLFIAINFYPHKGVIKFLKDHLIHYPYKNSA